MSTNHIMRFEEMVQRLVEGTFARLFAGRLSPLEVANALAHALEDHAVPRSGDLPLAPNHYWVALNPTDHAALLTEHPQLAEDLAHHLLELAHQAGFALPHLPTVDLKPQSDVALHQVRATAQWSPPAGAEAHPDSVDVTQAVAETGGEATQQMAPAASDAQAPADRPFLILEGRRHIALSRSTISLGRNLDNDIIVDDARVSRYHAQLRRRYGRYVIYDLGSTGGTTVNGYPIQECVLEAGDVISLAGVEIIYGQDVPTPPSPSGQTGRTPAWRDHRTSGTDALPPSDAHAGE